MTESKRVIRLKSQCPDCDGTGYYYHCDDRIAGLCVTGWDMPCDACEGRGWFHAEIERPDPKWARMWKQIAAASTKSDPYIDGYRA